MEAVYIASGDLCEKLSMSLGLVSALTVLSMEKETHLNTGDIEQLRAATEKEEELVADLGKLEKDREICAGALAKAIGVFDKSCNLSGLIEGITDAAIRQRLNDLKIGLNEAVNALTYQNDKVRQLLAQQIDYTHYMLNLIYVPKSKNHTYDLMGSRMDNVGEKSYLDFHV